MMMSHRGLTLDISSLYTNITHENGLNALMYYLAEHNGTSFPPSDFLVEMASYFHNRLEQRTRSRGIQSNLPLMKNKHMETWSTGVRQTIPDMGETRLKNTRKLIKENINR